MIQTRRGFTLVELVTAVAVIGLLVAVLMPMASRQRNASGLEDSIKNVFVLMAATHAYCADNAGRAPMRGCGYSSGQILGGWDGWNFGGKNCSAFWSGYFDEPAYARPLNAYVYPARLRRPTGYVNTGSGATWLFIHGTPTAADRAGVQITAYRSPGDVRSFERNWPTPTTGVSGYDDVGTSYLLNMKWWEDPTISTLPFTERYVEGARRVGLALGGARPNFVFIHDQIGEVVPYGTAATQVVGEFSGKVNYSVTGWADGRAGYVRMSPGASSGFGYTLFP